MEPLRGMLFVSLDENRWHDLPALGALLMARLAEGGEVLLDMSLDLSLLESPLMARYDVCVFYTVWASLSPPQEQALLDQARNGKGFVGIHTAACALPEHQGYIDMLGGTFRMHPPHGEFQVTIRDREHPITQGVEDFAISDELYVTDRAPDLHVLATAVHAEEQHPLAWCRMYGSGRVFYLALGHDAGAVGNPGFLALAERGIKWAGGRLG